MQVQEIPTTPVLVWKEILEPVKLIIIEECLNFAIGATMRLLSERFSWRIFEHRDKISDLKKKIKANRCVKKLKIDIVQVQ